MKNNSHKHFSKIRKIFGTIILLVFCISASAQKISGSVSDASGALLPGISVVVKGTTITAITDVNGRYSITDLKGNKTLKFSFIGMKTQEVNVGNNTTVNVVLLEDSYTLNEVVAVGYGSQKKVNLTGSVSTVNSKMLESRPVQNVSQALQGIIPGLNLQTTGLGGELNQALSVNIRGIGTISSTSKAAPLILIDGMEGNMNALNPQDIENLTVLKDAAASSIYGSRAAFGVILITTKSGKKGAAKVSYNSNFRWTSPLGMPKMMDSHTFALYWNEAAANDGEGAKFSQEMLDRIVKYQKGEIKDGALVGTDGKYTAYTGANANTDWFKEQYKSSAFSQEHSINLSGGSDAIQYFASGNFMGQDGLSRHGGDGLERYALSSKINTVVSKYVKFNLSNKFIREDFEKATHLTDLLYHNIARRWPTNPVVDPNGKYTDGSEIAQLENGGRVKDVTDRTYTQGQFIINPIKNWNIFAELNYQVVNRNYHSDVTPAYCYDSTGKPFAVAVGYNSPGYSSVYEYNYKSDFITTNIYTDYEFKINENHNFKLLGGFNSEYMKERTLGASRSGLINPMMPSINTATNDSKADEGKYDHWSTSGYFARINYNYKEKYLLELNARYDGSSRFLDEKRWNVFPSVSTGWNVSNEDFWNKDGLISLLKVRGSYGSLGNANTNNYYPFFVQLPFTANGGGWLLGGQKPNIASAPGLISSLLGWEKVATWNVGFDMALLRNRLQINFDYYNRMTNGMVGPAPELPVTLGTGVPNFNNTDMKSVGFELEAKWSDRIGKFTYGVRAVVSDDQQEVTNYPNKTGNISQYYSGRKIGEIWGYTTVGIAKTQAEMDAYLVNVSQSSLASKWGAGDIMYADLNGDKKIDGGAGILTDAGDKKIIGNSTPRFRFSLDLTGEWNGFDFRIFFQGVAKRDYMPNGPYFWGASGGMWQSAGFTEHMDYFRDENSVMVKAGKADVNLDAYFPKPYFNTGKNQQTQTRFMQNAAYLRLKNLQVGYTIPLGITSKVGVSKARVFVSGENLLTITKLTKLFDPETVGLSGWNDGKTYPLCSVLSCGLSVTF